LGGPQKHDRHESTPTLAIPGTSGTPLKVATPR
jgi:hypothetical protein